MTKSQTPVPYALIIVEGTEAVTTTNENGKYELELAAGSYEITASGMEYLSLTQAVTLAENDTLELNFVLEKLVVNLDSVEVIGSQEDLGIRIMRKVIAKRKENAGRVRTLETDIYLKGVMRTTKMPGSFLGRKLEDSDKVKMGLDSTGRGIIYLLEQNTHYYYQEPNKEFNYIHSVKTSGDAQGLGFAQLPPIINIYENNLTVLGGLNDRGFVSPASSQALMYYDFKFEGDYEDNGMFINKIKVIPKRKYDPLFSGYVYVVDGEWVFKSVDLLLTKESGIDILDSLYFRQTYNRYQKTDIWIIQNQTLLPHLELFGFGIGGNFITNYKHQKLNKELPKGVFEQKFLTVYDSTALKKNSAYWDTTRVVPLTDEEREDYILKDSLETVFKHKDSINATKVKYNFSLMNLLLSGPAVGNRKWSIGTSALFDMVRYNTVEGVNLRINPQYVLHIDKYNLFSVYGILRYGFASERWYQNLRLSYSRSNREQPAQHWKLNVEGGKYIKDLSGLQPVPGIVNSVASLWGWNYLKWYEANYVKMNANVGFGNGLSVEGGLSYEDRSSLKNSASYTFHKEHKSRITQNNPPDLPDFQNHKAFIVHLGLSYQPGWKYYKMPDFIQAVPGSNPVFELNYWKGIPGLSGSYTDFDKWQLGIRHQVNLKLLGVLDYHLVTGGFLNKKFVGNPDYQHYIGNRSFISSARLNSFQLAPYYKFSNIEDWYFRGHIEWNLAGLISNKIPVMKQLNWHLVLGSNSLYINKTSYYYEVFAGVDNIGYKMIRFGRVDFVLGYEAGIGKPQFGVRVGLDTGLFRSEN